MPEKDITLWMWAAGLFSTATLGLTSLIWRGQNEKIKTVVASVAKCSDDKVPRKEYEAEKDNTDKRFDKIDEGFTGVHKRLDNIFSQRRTDKRWEDRDGN